MANPLDYNIYKALGIPQPQATVPYEIGQEPTPEELVQWEAQDQPDIEKDSVPTPTPRPIPIPKNVNPQIQPEPIAPETVKPKDVDSKIQEKLSEADRLRGLLDSINQRSSLSEGAANIMRGLEKFNAARAGGGLTQIKPDTKFYEDMSKQASQQGETSTLQAIRADQERQAIMDKQKEMDRQVNVSQIYRDLLEKSGVSVPDNAEMKPDEAYKIAQAKRLLDQPSDNSSELKDELLKARIASYNAMARQRGVSADLAPEKFKYNKSEKFEDDLRRAVKDMRGTEKWKKAESTISAIPELKLLLNDAYDKGGQSLSMLGPKIAKGIAGEVGVLTEQDVTRYVKNPQIVRGMVDTLQKVKSGKLSQASYDNLNRLLELSKQAAEDKREQALDREANLLSKREKLNYDEARYLIDESFNKNSPKKSKYPMQVRKDGQVATVSNDEELKEAQSEGWN